MGMEWYDMIAKRNGGYKSNTVFTVEGISGEDVFEKELVQLLHNSKSTLDAGCGHGDFAIKMAKEAHKIIGFDWSIELLKIANSLKEHYKIDNVNFVHATTKAELPFEDGQFDLIYCRRGPTSIAYHSRVLRSSGTIYGICPEYPNIVDSVSKRLSHNGFVNIEINVFSDAILVFPNTKEFAKFLTAFPGNPDYTLPESKQMLDEIVNENMINWRLCYNQWRFIWKATKA
ncbi:class I SAM-dependent methyltransferase [Clostridium tagluense]|uniref:class I SAM-dependent methyltransferase n=1 Tax=Clostridium tagluense TaxID=360422 RepID=UPI001C0D410B|nr:class I SAM-dependent methyltransferase [Clostridium tagluense]MBU3129958.1 class I SAM-dependent methyltransferase [Clostridium tagluense]MCB2313637.1 class I SAM-dependent methyltransferase [Clostridium tagluense]MCB2318115.1 class I SAM-dependent methyltransferase [Clostridium tagluense]MCB2323949.1 class I SAM-dependent methyltransferase [Clostridium tagluense]MCB2327899.1 class I SAM-dependent methyltransferase [Clostridium tagluense]